MNVGYYTMVVCIMIPCSVATLDQSIGGDILLQLQIIKCSQYVASKCVSYYTI
jgi:hypothetical protein